ncbi:MAG TPA: hypothetical protein PK156_16415 [Polyangium sp.]|nr:hypothetical protein [Polyangium sp.]
MMRPDTAVSFVVPVLVASLAGCADPAKQEQIAVDVLAKVAPLADADAAQVRRGLPDGAKKLGEHIDSEPDTNLVALQRTVLGARVNTEDLRTSKCTFFSFADTSGVVLRSEIDPDNLAQKQLFKVFPGLKKALEPNAGIAEAWGDMEEMRIAKMGPEYQWVVAHAVKDKEGQTKGLFVTGWSLRRFAYHVDQAAKAELIKVAENQRAVKVPLVYAFIIKDGKAYGGPMAPDVNARALEGLDLPTKTQSGAYRGHVEVTGRMFGVAAQKAPNIGESVILSIMISEV